MGTEVKIIVPVFKGDGGDNYENREI
jgi:hypothetical protein